MNLQNSIPISTQTTFLFSPSGSHMALNSPAMGASVPSVMSQGPLGYQLPGGYAHGSQVGLSAAGMRAPMYQQLPYAGSVGNLAMPQISSGLVHQGQTPLPTQSAYGHYVVAQQPLYDGQTYQWSADVGPGFVSGGSQLPPGIVDYQSLLAQGTDVKATLPDTPPMNRAAAAPNQTATAQTNSEFSPVATDQSNGIQSPRGDYPQRSFGTAERALSPQNDNGGYKHQQHQQQQQQQQQPSSPSRQNTIPASLPPKLNPSLQLSTFGNSRSSTESGGNPPRRGSSTSSVTSPVTSPRGHELLANAVPCYEKPVKRDQCLRCFKKVYPLEQVGPIKEVMYHKTCFTCVACGTQLNLKNFGHNPNDLEDLNVFCMAHRPKERTLSVDADSIHIKRALNAPKLDKVNEQIRGDRYPSEVLARSTYGQPSASALVTRPENVYYGMGSGDQQQHQQHHHHQHNGQQYNHYGSSDDTPLGRQQQLDRNLGSDHPPLLRQQQVDQQAIHSHPPHQRQKSWERTGAHFTASGHNDTDAAAQFAAFVHHNNDAAPTTHVIRHDRQISNDDVFGAQVINASTNGRRPVASTSSSASYQSSRSSGVGNPITSDDGPPMDAVMSELSSKIRVIRVDSGGSTKDEAPLMRSDRPSNRSSRSASPDGPSRTDSRHEDGHSLRSSTGSTTSGHDFSDLDSSFTQHHFRRQTASTSSLERSDRPSMSSAHEHGIRFRVEMTRGSGKLEANDLTQVDPSRYLPPNEVRRMDRPSQYS